MRIWIVLVGLLLLAAAVGAVTYGQAQGEQPTPSEARPVLGVDEFMKEVNQHRGTVRVEGVVSSASAEKQLLALIDIKEFTGCKVTTCAKLSLPVHWTGEMPEVKDAVQIEGQVQESDGKKLFVARSLEKIELPQKPQ